MAAAHLPPQNPTQKNTTVAKQAGAMGAATFLSRIGGLVREQVFAFLFGASDVADAFNIAFRIPNLLRDLFAEGAMSAAFVPKFTAMLAESKDAAFKLLMAVLWTLLLGLTILCIVGVWFTPELVSLYAGGFKQYQWKYLLTVSLTQWMFPFFPMVAMAAVAMGALNAMGYFFLPAFAPALFNVASVFAGLVLCPLVGKYTTLHPIYGMAIGVVLGGALQFFVQWFKLRQLGLSLRTHGPTGQWLTPWRTPGVKAVLTLIIPGTIGLAATQLGILINSIYATGQGTGAVSWLNYAFRLMQFPIGIFGVSLAAATLPKVSRALLTQGLGITPTPAVQGLGGTPTSEPSPGATAGVDAGASSPGGVVADSLRLCFAVNLPAAAGLMAVGLPLIQAIFQHGNFNYVDAYQTAQALWWYALGLAAYSVVKIIVPIFYALGTTRVPVLSSFAMVALNAGLNHIFLNVYGFPFWSLAAATATTVTLNAFILLAWLSPKLPGLLSVRLAKGFFVSLLSAAAVYGASRGGIYLVDVLRAALFQQHDTSTFIVWLLQVSAALGFSLITWLGLGWAFNVPEISQGLNLIKRKFIRRG